MFVNVFRLKGHCEIKDVSVAMSEGDEVRDKRTGKSKQRRELSQAKGYVNELQILEDTNQLKIISPRKRERKNILGLLWSYISILINEVDERGHGITKTYATGCQKNYLYRALHEL